MLIMQYMRIGYPIPFQWLPMASVRCWCLVPPQNNGNAGGFLGVVGDLFDFHLQ
jgi:hypothetical protein